MDRIWQEELRAFFDSRSENISKCITFENLCYVSGKDSRLWGDGILYGDLLTSIQEQLRIAKQHSLLEVGCASGFLALGLSKLVTLYTGIDISKKAIFNSYSLKIENAVFRVADGVNLPFGDNSFHRAICYDVFINIPYFEIVLSIIKDMVRVVRPGGMLMIGAVPDDAMKDYQQKIIQKLVIELDKNHGPLNDIYNEPLYSDSIVVPRIHCYYFKKHDFVCLGEELGLLTEINDIHAKNPYLGCRFNVVYTKPV